MSAGETVSITIHKKWLYAVAGAALGFGAGYGTALVADPGSVELQAATAEGGGLIEASRVDVDIAGQPTLGAPDAPITMVEFADFQCPYCGRFHRETKGALLEEYGDRLRYVVLHFPLRSIHPQAQKAAEAAECARDQDAFFEYADILYRHQRELAPTQLLAYAGDAGLDPERFAACLESGEKADVVDGDIQEGLRHGVRSTPTFFVNGRRILGAQPLPSFRAAIDAALGERRAD